MDGYYSTITSNNLNMTNTGTNAYNDTELQKYYRDLQLTLKRRDFSNCRSCNKNLAGNGPASQYQRQKLIQNTVRVSSSLYTMNLAALSAYKKPLANYQPIEQSGSVYLAPPGVNWNQMSDRPVPSVQTAQTSSGSTYRGSSTRHTIVRNRPGAMAPGGIGVDIKHNSYDRYLNRLKGKSVLRRGVIPPNYGQPVPFTRAYPIYGGKTVKTGIISNCDCPDITDNSIMNARIYDSPLNSLQDQILSIHYEYHVGDFVWASKLETDTKLYKAEILNIENDIYTIQFVDDETIVIKTINSIFIYFDCECSDGYSIDELTYASLTNGIYNNSVLNLINNKYCNISNIQNQFSKVSDY
jgi:hypothetical protein